MRHHMPDWAWTALNYCCYGASKGLLSQTALGSDEYPAGTDRPTHPPTHGTRLAAAWGSPTSIFLLTGTNHDDILLHPRFRLDVRGLPKRL